MPLDRLPRQLLVSWMSEPRLCNYNQTFSRTALKALASVGIEEADWPALAENEIEWSCYVRQAVGEFRRGAAVRKGAGGGVPVARARLALGPLRRRRLAVRRLDPQPRDRVPALVRSIQRTSPRHEDAQFIDRLRTAPCGCLLRQRGLFEAGN